MDIFRKPRILDSTNDAKYYRLVGGTIPSGNYTTLNLPDISGSDTFAMVSDISTLESQVANVTGNLQNQITSNDGDISTLQSQVSSISGDYIDGSGVANQVAYFTDTKDITGNSGFTYDGTDVSILNQLYVGGELVPRGGTLDTNSNVVIGDSVTIDTTGVSNSILIGDNSSNSSDGSTVLGKGASNTGKNSILIGERASNTSFSSVVIGQNAIGQQDEVIVIGKNTVGSASNCIYIGYNINTGFALAFNSILIGSGTDIGGGSVSHNGIGIGVNATIEGKDGVSLGSGASYDGDGCISIGPQANTVGSSDIAIGLNSSAGGGSTIALGNSAITTSENQIALGHNANSIHSKSIAIGHNASTNASNQFQIGDSTTPTSAAESLINSIRINNGTTEISITNPISFNSYIEVGSLSAASSGNLLTWDQNKKLVDSGLNWDGSTFTINGKLTVTGLIDPTGLELTPTASNPGNVSANTIWIDSGDSTLNFETGIKTNNNNVNIGTGKIITTLENIFVETSGGREALSTNRFGYSNPQYKVLKIGNSSTSISSDTLTLSFGVDTEAVTGGSFTGDGREIVIRRNASFITPNLSGTDWQKVFNLDNDVLEFSIPLDTQGNNIELGGGSITSDTDVVTVDDVLNVSGRIRATGTGYPGSGAGIEFSYSGGIGYIYPYDRDAPSYKPLELIATQTTIKDIGTTLATFDSTGITLGVNLDTNDYDLEIGNGSIKSDAGYVDISDDLITRGIEITDGYNIILDTGTGTKIGTGTNQKIGFWNVTPVIQPATTGTTTGFTAGTGTAVNDDSTFTGGTGTKAYTIGDIVLALKQAGLMASS